MKRFLRTLILGPEKYIEDYSTYRRALLLGYMELAAIGISGFYLSINFYRGLTPGNIQYITVILISIAALYLTRLGYYTISTVVQMILVNSVVFYFSWFYNGDANYLYFISNALAALVLLGYKNRWAAFGIILMTGTLFLISYTGVFGYHPKKHNMYLLINYIFVFSICVLILYYTLRLHHHAEKITQAKNAQLRKANAELDRFVYSASHDLRAPLSSLLGLIELAFKTNDKQELETYLNMMKGRVHHLDDFIKEIIDYSRNERMEVVKLPVNLYDLVEEISFNLKHLDGADRIEIQNEIPKDLVMPSDAMRLKIVLNNLLNNAIKYHDHNKKTRYIRVSVTRAGDGMNFSVVDNGMGISAEHHDKVFNMFYRASDKSKGSGLGLYIVKESLGQLGGSVTLKSELGEGSTFTIQLPA